VKNGEWWWQEVRCGEFSPVKPFYIQAVGTAVILGIGAAHGGGE
jgi:hypothetical protein